MTQRTDRIDELLRQEIGKALEREVTDPRIGFVTVTDVETVPDLSRARVWVSIIGTEDQRKETLRALRGAMPFIRRGLGAKIRIRKIPELDVRLDESIERGSRVLQILSDLEEGRTPEDATGRRESLPTPVGRIRQEGDLEEEPMAPDLDALAASKPRPRRTRTGTFGKPGGKSGTRGGSGSGKKTP
jgi:ribosome-binding factor A